MSTNNIMGNKAKSSFFFQRISIVFSLLCLLTFIFACSDDDENMGSPYDPNKPITLTKFYPDSGGMATNVIIEGTNFGTDPSLIKVYYNKKEAAVVSATGDKLYVITPRQPGDTCKISVVAGKDSLTFDNTFEYTSVTRVTTIAGNPGIDDVIDGSLVTAGFRDPRALTVDKEGNIFVCEFDGFAVRRINMEKKEVSTLKRDGFVGGKPNAPDVDAFGKVVLVPMDEGFTFYEFDPERLWEPKKFEMMVAEDSRPIRCQWKHSVAACPLDGMMYTRSFGGELIKFDPKTKKCWLVEDALEPSNDSYEAFDPTHPEWLYISFRERRYIGRYNVLTNVWEPYAGVGNIGYLDGDRRDAAFGQIQQLCFDKDGNLYITDSGNHCIRKMAQNGIVSTVVGIGGKEGYKDGDPETALFSWPTGVYVHPNGDVYVADRNNNCVRKLSIE